MEHTVDPMRLPQQKDASSSPSQRPSNIAGPSSLYCNCTTVNALENPIKIFSFNVRNKHDKHHQIQRNNKIHNILYYLKQMEGL